MMMDNPRPEEEIFLDKKKKAKESKYWILRDTPMAKERGGRGW